MKKVNINQSVKEKSRKIVNVVIPARNEEEHILATLKSLDRQTHPPSYVVVVDDGSKDNTVALLRKFKPIRFQLGIVERPERIGGESLVGKPKIAETFNKGFEKACKEYYDYILVIGADTQLEPTYIEKLLIEFKKNPRLAIASGHPPHAPMNPDHARGSGRIFDVRFWKWYGERYPVSYGWESQCQIECLRVGLEVRSFSAIKFHVSRKGQGTVDFYDWGRGMRAMGYNPIIVILRGFRFIISQKYGIRSAVRLIAGFFSRGSQFNLSRRQKKTRKFLFKYQLVITSRKLKNALTPVKPKQIND
ncbi:MAG: glycosyltransferase family 2 protein [Candidatus Heimdallarchaeota archaeon]|nr:MAG: glycosyltransferase family 2 protein [Candidatus Heimdallarchaeota archaeon]